jgi:hypothetical protein
MLKREWIRMTINPNCAKNVTPQHHIGSAGELNWEDGIDLCSDAIYLKVSGK